MDENKQHDYDEEERRRLVYGSRRKRRYSETRGRRAKRYDIGIERKDEHTIWTSFRRIEWRVDDERVGKGGGGRSTCLKVAFTLLYAALICVAGVVQKLSVHQRGRDVGNFDYNVNVAITISETIKFMIASCGLLFASKDRRPDVRGETTRACAIRRSHLLGIAFISVLYCAWNSLSFYILLFIDPVRWAHSASSFVRAPFSHSNPDLPSQATLFVIHNLKIVFTAIFMRAAGMKQIAFYQWIALLTLTLGVILSQADRDVEDTVGERRGLVSAAGHPVALGIALAFVRAAGTAGTNVCCEFLSKRNHFWTVRRRCLSVFSAKRMKLLTLAIIRNRR